MSGCKSFSALERHFTRDLAQRDCHRAGSLSLSRYETLTAAELAVSARYSKCDVHATINDPAAEGNKRTTRLRQLIA